ncbi:hypothetical protein [Leucobacter salsicius]|uniref:hypothetical protein n=1 Tax=Leucobacter salsicius TaxID=664638 RepID=UPI00034CAAB8|nr:hypothetical protein [Leucobacter salsicius]
MTTRQRERVNVKTRYWRNPRTDTNEHVILIYRGGIFVRLNIEEARRIVDKVHDLCDAYEAEQRSN